MTYRVWRARCDGVRPSPLADTSRDPGGRFGGFGSRDTQAFCCQRWSRQQAESFNGGRERGEQRERSGQREASGVEDKASR